MKKVILALAFISSFSFFNAYADMCPDGSFVTGSCVLMPNGKYVGR